MKITLVYPSFGEGSHSRYFPFGLAYVAACLSEAGHNVSVVDMEGDNLSVKDAVKHIVDLSPQVIAFGGMVTRFRYVKELSDRLRQELPGVFMLAGNSGATYFAGAGDRCQLQPVC